MDKIKKVATRAQKFVDDHKVAIAITATATACLALNRRNMKVTDEFLREHGLYDEFYALPNEA